MLVFTLLPSAQEFAPLIWVCTSALRSAVAAPAPNAAMDPRLRPAIPPVASVDPAMTAPPMADTIPPATPIAALMAACATGICVAAFPEYVEIRVPALLRIA